MPPTIPIPVVEAKEILTSLEDAKSLRSLSDDHRRLLDQTIWELERAIDNAEGSVELPESTIQALLRCIRLSQAWTSFLFD